MYQMPLVRYLCVKSFYKVTMAECVAWLNFRRRIIRWEVHNTQLYGSYLALYAST